MAVIKLNSIQHRGFVPKTPLGQIAEWMETLKFYTYVYDETGILIKDDLLIETQ